MHGATKHEISCTSTVGKRVRSGSEMHGMNVWYTCMLDTRHERSAHAEKQKQRQEARCRDRSKRSLVHRRCSRPVRKREEKSREEDGR